jgi:hypothetical protein
MRLSVACAAMLLVALGAGAAFAQGLPIPGANIPQNLPQQKGPPVKKLDGICYPPESPFYKRITEGFVPFVAMVDCVKSGGTPSKR